MGKEKTSIIKSFQNRWTDNLCICHTQHIRKNWMLSSKAEAWHNLEMIKVCLQCSFPNSGMFLLHRKIPGPTVGKAKAKSEAGFVNDENIFCHLPMQKRLFPCFAPQMDLLWYFSYHLMPRLGIERTSIPQIWGDHAYVTLDHHYVSAHLVCSFSFLLL